MKNQRTPGTSYAGGRLLTRDTQLNIPERGGYPGPQIQYALFWCNKKRIVDSSHRRFVSEQLQCTAVSRDGSRNVQYSAFYPPLNESLRDFH